MRANKRYPLPTYTITFTFANVLVTCVHVRVQKTHLKAHTLNSKRTCPPHRLRFDFSNNGAVEPAKLAAVEAICRDWVARGLAVSSKEVALADAKGVKGLRAVFGEVRVCMCVLL